MLKCGKTKATQANVLKLKCRNFGFIGPSIGQLACGEHGEGRMTDVNEIEITIKNYINRNYKIESFNNTGPTREYIDPVRYISNESSGLQGYQLAKNEQLASNKLILGPSKLKLMKSKCY